MYLFAAEILFFISCWVFNKFLFIVEFSVGSKKNVLPHIYRAFCNTASGSSKMAPL